MKEVKSQNKAPTGGCPFAHPARCLGRVEGVTLLGTKIAHLAGVTLVESISEA